MSRREVEKIAFGRHLRQVADDAGTGAFTVVTDANRSVLLRLSGGRITSSHCRGRDITEALGVLAAAATVRYTFSRAAAEDRPELIGIDDFLRHIGAFVPPGVGEIGTGSASRGEVGAASSVARAIDEAVRADLESLATDIIGPVAQVVVEEAMRNTSDLHAAIAEIARSIPDGAAGSAFLEAARARFPDIDRGL